MFTVAAETRHCVCRAECEEEFTVQSAACTTNVQLAVAFQLAA